MNPTPAAPPRARRLPLAALMCMLLALAGLNARAATPPNLIHYQGVLLDGAGNPITTPQTIYFSVIDGGDATTLPSPGVLKYREHASVTPDAHGVFEHQIGSGTPVSGSLTPALFKSANAIYLEIAVADPNVVSNILLPRSRFTSVGYAFVADNAVGDITPKSVSIAGVGQVIDSSGNWVGGSVGGGLTGTPHVTSVTDATGGLLVSGDRLTIRGSGLTNASVQIGGKAARLVGAATATQLQCQVPAGLPMGLNPVAVIDDAATTNTHGNAPVAQVDVHRLLVAVRTGGAVQLVIFDANTRTVVATLTRNEANANLIIRNTDDNGDLLTLQGDWGDEGALFLMPSGTSTIYAIDMTANPPAVVATFSTGSKYRGVGISPDGTELIACDFGSSGGNQLRNIALTQTQPPFTGSLFGATSGLESSEVPTSFGATGARFVSDTQFVALGRLANSIISYQRDPSLAINNINHIQRVLLTDLPSGLTNVLATGSDPVRLQLTPDRTRMMLVTRDSTNIKMTYVSQFWSAGTPGISFSDAAAGPLPFKMAMSPVDGTIYVASHDASNNQLYDRLKIYSTVGQNIGPIGEVIGPQFTTSECFEIADIEPVTGDLLAVATNYNKLFFAPVKGGSVPVDADDTHTNSTYLSLKDYYQFTTANQDCVELTFQP